MIDLNNPAVKQALIDVEKMNTKHQWASLEIFDFTDGPVIKLDYGTIHSNGMHERAIATRNYTMWADKVQVYTEPHA
jgi:hypothetical protein